MLTIHNLDKVKDKFFQTPKRMWILDEVLEKEKGYVFNLLAIKDSQKVQFVLLREFNQKVGGYQLYDEVRGVDSFVIVGMAGLKTYEDFLKIIRSRLHQIDT